MSIEDKKQASTAIFDICDTLYYSNTTHDFVAYYFERQPITLRKAGFVFSNHRFSPLRYFLILVGIALKWDILRKANIFLLRGLEREELERLAVIFVKEFLFTRKINETHVLIEDCKRNGLQVVLCSSSIEPVVSAIADDLGIKEFVGATLDYLQGKSSGLIAEDTTGKKLKALGLRNLDGEIALAVSDNQSDLPLLKAAVHPVAVVHSPRKLKFWSQFPFEIIDLSK